MPPSPCTGSTSTATMSRCSDNASTAAKSLNGTRTKPSSSGAKPSCTLALAVADRVAMVRPWKLPSITTTVGRAICLREPYRRAILMAASLASAPELEKNTFAMPLNSHRRCASDSWAGTRYKLEVCINRLACSARVRVTAGWQWPRLHTPIPEMASMYLWLFSSYNHTPSPRTKATGWRA